MGWYLERVQDLVGPAPLGDVEEERSGGVGGVDRPLAGEPETNVVLGQHDAVDACIDAGLVPPEPQQLRSGEARERAVAGQRDQPLELEPLLYLGALRRRALVVPEDRRTEDVASFAQAYEAVHLAREPDAAISDTEPRQSGLTRAPPVLGILLRPARLWRRQAVVLLRRCDHLSLGRDRKCLDAGRSDVEADERGHAPRAAYTSSYARTASLRCCASRSAASSIFAATESMKRHCSTLRFTASTASSVYGYRSNPRRSPLSP